MSNKRDLSHGTLSTRKQGLITIKYIAVLFLFLSFTQTGWAQSQSAANDTVTSYPKKPQDISPLLIGEKIPSVQLPDVQGQPIDLIKKVNAHPTILIFYRGGWCPFCNKHLSGIQQIEPELRSMGYQIIAISTDAPGQLSKTADKQHLTYSLLSDADLAVSKAFGLAYVAPKNYEKTLIEGSNGKNVDKLLPVPSVFIIDTKGVIQFEYVNPDFMQRINPKLLLAAAGAVK